MEITSKKYEATTSVENKIGQTCGGWQLGAIYGEHLGCNDMLSCKGAEDAAICLTPLTETKSAYSAIWKKTRVKTFTNKT